MNNEQCSEFNANLASHEAKINNHDNVLSEIKNRQSSNHHEVMGAVSKLDTRMSNHIKDEDSTKWKVLAGIISLLIAVIMSMTAVIYTNLEDDHDEQSKHEERQNKEEKR